jgi:Rha family phage regulatory protein
MTDLMLRTADYLVHESQGIAKTTSLLVAEKFGKRHDNVIRAMENLECSEEFSLLNFEEGSYLDVQDQKRPMYEMTKDGFTFLAMGFTGKRAAEFKEKYIAAFNQMDNLIRDRERIAAQDQLTAYILQLLAEGRISRMVLPDGTVVSFKKHSPAKTSPLGQSSSREEKNAYPGIENWLEYKLETSWPDIAEHFPEIKLEKKKDKSLQMQVAESMRGAGWERKTAWRNGKTRKIWAKK